jgi:hypothetical protein
MVKKIKKTVNIGGEDVKVKHFIYGDESLDNLRKNLSELAEKVFCDVQRVSLSIIVTKNDGKYDYDIDYGDARLSFEEVVNLQEMAREAFDLNSNSKRIGLDYNLSNRTFDPLGLRTRIWRYLTN